MFTGGGDTNESASLLFRRLRRRDRGRARDRLPGVGRVGALRDLQDVRRGVQDEFPGGVDRVRRITEVGGRRFMQRDDLGNRVGKITDRERRVGFVTIGEKASSRKRQGSPRSR